MVRDGGVIAAGYDAGLDELRRLQTNAGEFLVALEARERERTGIPNLRVEYNRVHGFYIEVTNAHAEKVPTDYRRRQTLKNAERYITPELKAFEDKALSAQERALALEKRLYDELLETLAPDAPRLQSVARAVAELDVLAAFAAVALERGLDAAVVRRRARDRHRRRAASGGRGRGRTVHRQRHAALSHAPDAADHRPEHGRQVDLHAAGRADRAARARRQLRAGARRAHRPGRPASSPASAPPTTSRADDRRSWWR